MPVDNGQSGAQGHPKYTEVTQKSIPAIDHPNHDQLQMPWGTRKQGPRCHRPESAIGPRNGIAVRIQLGESQKCVKAVGQFHIPDVLQLLCDLMDLVPFKAQMIDQKIGLSLSTS